MSVENNEKDEKSMKEKLHEVIKERIFRYVRENNITQEEFSMRLGVSSTTISRWINNETSLPPVYQLPALATLLGTTVDALLSGEEITIDKSICATYAKAYLTLTELAVNGIIHPGSDDPFLDWMLYTKMEIDGMQMVSADKKNAWQDKLLKDFNKPILSKYLTQYIELFKYIYKEINEYDTYLSVFNLLQGYGDGTTKDEVDSLIQRWHNSVLTGSDEFKHLTVPYGGIMFTLDKNGKACVTEKPTYVEAVPDEYDPDHDDEN